MDKFRNISASRWAVTGIAVVAVLIPATFGVVAVSASAATPTPATASTTTLYQQEGNGGAMVPTGATIVAISPYVPAGTYLVSATLDVSLSSISDITCGIGSNASGSTVHGSQGSTSNFNNGGISPLPGNVALSATAVLTKPLNRIELSCNAYGSVSVINYSVTEQAVAKLILN